jgi:hypothetical protein
MRETRGDSAELETRGDSASHLWEMRFVVVLFATILAAAEATCGTHCGGCTATCANDPTQTCVDCGPNPCVDVGGFCWSCYGCGSATNQKISLPLAPHGMGTRATTHEALSLRYGPT